MFFKRKSIKISRFLFRSLFLFNLFFNFNLFFFEFLGSFGYLKIFITRIFVIKSFNFLKIFSLYSNFNVGFSFSLLLNIIKGLIFGYNKKLIVFGTGYKLLLKGKYIYFYLSYSHPVICFIPKNIFISLNLNEIDIISLDKQEIGKFCMILRNIKKPDAYKGKGIRYLNEKINLKIIKKN